jgi:hypothetical protein
MLGQNLTLSDQVIAVVSERGITYFISAVQVHESTRMQSWMRRLWERESEPTLVFHDGLAKVALIGALAPCSA